MATQGEYQFYNDCVNWPKRDVAALTDMIDSSIDITRKTFLKHVGYLNVAPIEAQLGYVSHWKQGLTMAGDWHISYHRSKLRGKRVYFFKWSAIEFVFTRKVKK